MLGEVTGREEAHFGTGALGAVGLVTAMFGQGVAGADTLSDVTGKYYGQAKEVLSEAGLTPIVATRVGDVATDDNCVIDRIQNATLRRRRGQCRVRHRVCCI